MLVVLGRHLVTFLRYENTCFIIFFKEKVRTMKRNYWSVYKIGKTYSSFSFLRFRMWDIGKNGHLKCDYDPLLVINRVLVFLKGYLFLVFSIFFFILLFGLFTKLTYVPRDKMTAKIKHFTSDLVVKMWSYGARTSFCLLLKNESIYFESLFSWQTELSSARIRYVQIHTFYPPDCRIDTTVCLGSFCL